MTTYVKDVHLDSYSDDKNQRCGGKKRSRVYTWRCMVLLVQKYVKMMII